jgi:ribosome-binding protein aMBF1 (putative translation factor)
MKFQDFKNKLLKDPKFFKEFNKQDIKLEIALMVMDARILKGLTQKELAKKLKTKQSSISRIENGNYVPSINFLEKMARVLKAELILPKFEFNEENKNSVVDKSATYGPVAQVVNRMVQSRYSSKASTKTVPLEK